MTAAIQIDVDALLTVVVASLVIGIGMTAVFSVGISSFALYDDARMNDQPGRATFFAVVAIICAILCLGGLVVGLIVMVQK